MIFIDADHHYESCKLDFELWSPLLEVGGEVAFHDIDTVSVNKVISELDDSWEEIEGKYLIRAFKKIC